MRRIRVAAAALALLIAGAGAAQAQTAASPDIPDLNFTPTGSDRGNFHKYFFYWKEGVTAGRAAADLRECRSYMGIAPQYHADMHLVLNDAPVREHGRGNAAAGAQSYGPVGAVIGELIGGGLTFRAGQQKLRMCMGFKQYTRFGAPKPLWEAINKGDAEAAIARQAAIASGARPAGEPIDP